METKQTAVEWLAEQIKFTNKEMYAELQEVITNAQAMEKWQIANAHWNGGEIFTDTGKLVTGEMYYNETYNKQDNEF